MTRLMELIKGRKRRIFLEASPTRVEQAMRGQISELDPYGNVIHEAQKRGWEIRRLSPRGLLQTIANRSSSPELVLSNLFGRAKEDATLDYLVMNLQERYWAQKIRRANPRPGDLILMNPTHVRGVIREFGAPLKVIWIDKPRRGYDVKRLTREELKRFLTMRKAWKIKRNQYRRGLRR